MATMSVVESSLDGGVLTVTLADEANRNALSGRLVTELTEALDRADADPEVRVVVLTNRGSVFCAGADLRERSSRPSLGSDRLEESGPSATPPNPSEGPSLSPSSAARQEAPSRSATSPDPLPGSRSQRAFTSPVADLLGRFRRSPKPYVGRIAGHCVAGGMGLAAAMDISIAPHEAKFGFTEVRLGLAPAMISALCLPKMSPADAASAFLRGNRFPAAEAARMGLITAAVESHQLDDAVGAAVADLLAGSPQGLAASKRLLERVPALGFDEALEWASSLSAELFASEEAAEGMAAFLEKRPPRWAPQ